MYKTQFTKWNNLIIKKVNTKSHEKRVVLFSWCWKKCGGAVQKGNNQNKWYLNISIFLPYSILSESCQILLKTLDCRYPIWIIILTAYCYVFTMTYLPKRYTQNANLHSILLYSFTVNCPWAFSLREHLMPESPSLTQHLNGMLGQNVFITILRQLTFLLTFYFNH